MHENFAKFNFTAPVTPVSADLTLVSAALTPMSAAALVHAELVQRSWCWPAVDVAVTEQRVVDAVQGRVPADTVPARL